MTKEKYSTHNGRIVQVKDTKVLRPEPRETFSLQHGLTWVYLLRTQLRGGDRHGSALKPNSSLMYLLLHLKLDLSPLLKRSWSSSLVYTRFWLTAFTMEPNRSSLCNHGNATDMILASYTSSTFPVCEATAPLIPVMFPAGWIRGRWESKRHKYFPLKWYFGHVDTEEVLCRI